MEDVMARAMQLSNDSFKLCVDLSITIGGNERY
jgi:hypothetical protein